MKIKFCFTSWATFEQYFVSLLVRSSFTKHLDTPQVEHHPHYVQTALVEYCSRLGIHFQAYSSLGTTVDAQTNPLLNDELVGRLARRYAKTPAQVLLRWATQQEIGVLPKSLNPLHIAENIALDWDLAKEDVLELNRLEEKRKYAWDPSSVVWLIKGMRNSHESTATEQESQRPEMASTGGKW